VAHLLAGRSAAEDGGRAAFLSREEWRVRQGKKVARPPLRLRRSRRQPSCGQIKPSRGGVDAVSRGRGGNRGDQQHTGNGDAPRAVMTLSAPRRGGAERTQAPTRVFHGRALPAVKGGVGVEKPDRDQLRFDLDRRRVCYRTCSTARLPPGSVGSSSVVSRVNASGVSPVAGRHPPLAFHRLDAGGTFASSARRSRTMPRRPW